MPIRLGPGEIEWKAPDADESAMLAGLQPNIVRPHVRDHLQIVFVTFASKAAGQTFLRGVRPLMKSAATHLAEVEAFNLSGGTVTGTSYVGVGLTPAGYVALGVPAGLQPNDSSFAQSMRGSIAKLGDPALSKWENELKTVSHAIVLVGDATADAAAATITQVRALIAANAGVRVVGEQVGVGQHNSAGDGIEHFGYVDGRSQPLFLKEDVDHERLHSTGVSGWSPAFSINRVIVADPAAPDPAHHFGSYLVYRKLEQNVQLFKRQEAKLAERLILEGDDAERAGAMIIGRFEDGTPLAMQADASMHHPVPNNFNYDDDPDGMRCPFLGHVRKVNPRGTGGFEPVAQERLHIMARRGQTYGTRLDDPNDGKFANKPKDKVGLLFMAFNVDIAEQFEFVQQTWANNPGFPRTPSGQPAGADLVIAQANRAAPITVPVEWAGDVAGDVRATATFPQAVTMKGGDYFFMPSLPFLDTL